MDYFTLIYNILSVVILVLFAYSMYLLIRRRLANKRYDQMFGINTGGLRNWDKKGIYNRTESTPYLALNSFTNEYKMNPEDGLVDFGCGKGRVALFLYDRYKINVTGIELNELTYNEAIDNIESYGNKHDTNCKVNIEMQFAEDYQIKTHENKFFFFNPFDVSIFKKVVQNIIKDAKTNSKEVEIILYYPLGSYRKFLSNETPFKLSQKIKAQGAIGFREKFLVYKFTP